MANLPNLVNIGIDELVVLLGYYQASVDDPDCGDLGTKTYEDMLLDISRHSICRISPENLESLVYQYKQAIFEKLPPFKAERRHKNYHRLMKRLADEIPQLFKKLPSGEISFINFEDRTDDG